MKVICDSIRGICFKENCPYVWLHEAKCWEDSKVRWCEVINNGVSFNEIPSPIEESFLPPGTTLKKNSREST